MRRLLLDLCLAVPFAACDDGAYAPPRLRDSLRKDFDVRAFAGTDWDSLGFLAPFETCEGRGWRCAEANPNPGLTLALVWQHGEPEASKTVLLRHSALQPDASVTPILRPTQRLCYLDGPEPSVLLYAC